jgi:hypothetical protein
MMLDVVLESATLRSLLCADLKIKREVLLYEDIKKFERCKRKFRVCSGSGGSYVLR